MADTGLLVTHAFRDRRFADNELYRAILLDKLSVDEGMLMENVVAQALKQKMNRLYFFSRTDSLNRENHIEIDFLVADGRKVNPVEVKSAGYRAHSSLDKFRAKFSRKIGTPYLLYTKDVMIKEGVVHLPLYMAALL